MGELNSNYQTKSAVLFVIFNRPDTTVRVFEQIRAVKPKRLYIAADAPRPEIEGEDLICAETRAIINAIDWDCELKTLFKDKNVGCREGVSSAVTWFFENEEEGIILEDDCLPAISFFNFCDTLLERYRDDTRIRHITGCNLQQGKKWGNSTYYFSNMTHVWGWASWKRVWKDYDKNLNKYNNDEVEEQLRNIFEDPLVVDTWKHIFEEVKAGKINAWGYQLDFANFFNNGLTIIPNENMISNIGFDSRATHTLDENSIYANMPIHEIDEITNPVFILPEKQADLLVLNRDFNIEEKRRRQNAFRKKVKRWFKSVIKRAATFLA
ncbi:nucleotide-diphospho-sugar transferase [Mucilaginibacter sp.]|uniref:nucleotide-diphospho-sugar transferase n=1 Tax=Mucilaginibacter sp. TaxID=1882438 RepID=UPI003D11E85A